MRLVNLGCTERGRPSDGPLDHGTGRGWVRARKGLYHDAVHVKRSATELVLHETLGGGFSPPAVARVHRCARAAKRVDRTRYTSRGRISFLQHHTQRISLGLVKANSRGILDTFCKMSASIARA